MPLQQRKHGKTPVVEALPPELQSVCETVRSFGDLAENWDTYGGIPASKAAILSAIAVLDGLGSSSLGHTSAAIPFHTAPLGHGGVQLEWRHLGDALEIEIGMDGSLGLLFDRPGSSGRFEERDDLSSDEALRLLEAFLST